MKRVKGEVNINTRLLAGYLIILLVLLSGCDKELTVSVGQSNYMGQSVAVIDRGNYFDVTIDYTSGLTCREIGKEFARGIMRVVPDYEILVDSYIAQTSNNNQYQTYIYRVEDLIPQLDSDYLDEIEGMAEVFSGKDINERNDSKVSRDEFLVFNLFPDIARGTQCCFVSVFSSRSAINSTITGRNLDWYGGDNNELPRIQAIITYKYSDKEICSIGFLGFMGIITGFNNSKVFAAILDSQSGESFNSIGKRSYPLDLRTALKTSSTLSETAEFMKDIRKYYTTNHIIALSDTKESVILENNFSGTGEDNKRVQRALRRSDSALNKGITWDITDAIGSVNSFLLYGNYDNHKPNKYNTQRWDNMRRRLLDAGFAVNVEDIKKVITYNHGSPGTFSQSGGLYNRMTLQMVLFEPQSLSLEVFFRPKNQLRNPDRPVFEKIKVFK